MSCVSSRQSSLHSIHSIHSPLNSLQNVSHIQEALAAARAHDAAMSALRKSVSPPGTAAGASPSNRGASVPRIAAAPEAERRNSLSNSSSPPMLHAPTLLKYSRADGLAVCAQSPPGADPAEATSSMGNSASFSSGSWNPGVVGSVGTSVAFTKWLHMQHKYENCKDTTSERVKERQAGATANPGQAGVDEIPDGELGKRASKMAVEAKEGSGLLLERASKRNKTGSPCPSPLHSVSRATLDDLLGTNVTQGGDSITK